MSKAMKWLLALLIAVMVGLLCAVVLLLSAYRGAYSSMEENAAFRLEKREDGTVLLRWPESESAERYCLSIDAIREGGGGERLYLTVCDTAEAVLPAWIPEDTAVRLQVFSMRDYRFLGASHIRMGKNPLTAAGYLNPPAADNCSAFVDLDHDVIHILWEGWQGDRYRLYLLDKDGGRTLLQELEHVGAQVRFGPEEAVHVPESGEELRFVIEPFRESAALSYSGCPSEVALARGRFLGGTLELECADLGDNAYVLRWNETVTDRYEVFRVDPANGAREKLAELAPGAAREYQTGRLAPFTDYCFRVIALGADGDYAAESAEISLRTGNGLMYATVWPLREIEVRSLPNGGEKLGTLSMDEGYCVTGEEDGWLRVSTPELSGYVNGKLCMIDLTEYLGPLCAYDITNSYSSIYRVHEFDIPRVTDTVVSGYENVLLPDGRFLVPLLYPTAQKLIASAQKALADGYRLKIYDSFRPNQATRSIYDLTNLILGDPLPERTFDDRGAEAAGGAETYAQLMTNGIYSLGSFLASSGSMHNFGVALDLTLERVEDGAEQEMQTAIHDLSWYSASARNNLNANHLRNYMKYGEFGGLSSEWWHYQDNDAFSGYGLSNRWNGVTPKGWRLDETGWHYRLGDGSFAADTELEIGGTMRRFDRNGYLVS